jgi:hypothetical protein
MWLLGISTTPTLGADLVWQGAVGSGRFEDGELGSLVGFAKLGGTTRAPEAVEAGNEEPPGEETAL